MANGDASFPKIADTNWWKLRDLFKTRVPAVVTPSYLASALSMTEDSAKSNLLSPFKKIGMIDDGGKPTDLVYDWRDDTKYAAVCSSLIERFYPQEVRDLFHSADADSQKLTSWFMSAARCGEPAAKHYARFYLLLLKADINSAETATAKKEVRVVSKSEPVKKKATSSVQPRSKESPVGVASAVVSPNIPTNPAQPISPSIRNSPELHINIQLHISPESTADQIDKIFESMARHLKGFNK